MNYNYTFQEFIEIFGNSKYEEIYQFLYQNDLIDQFLSIIDDLNLLFDFSLHYGILSLLQFLYQYKNVSYNYKILEKYVKSINQNINFDDPNLIPIISSPNENSRVNYQILDKFSIKRNLCIEYLIYMKKFSKMNYINNNYIYKYNKKYDN
jgi:hypothetical protein